MTTVISEYKNLKEDEKFWGDDVTQIFKHSDKFFPLKKYKLEERLNSILRLSLYGSLILSIYHNNFNYLYILLFFILFTYIIYYNRSQKKESQNIIEKMDNIDECVKPTLDNPFMNATMKDYMNLDENGKIKERAPACDINNTEIKKDADTFFNNNLFRDVNDLFGKMNSQRQFYTNPSTTIPNDQENFAKWLYLNPATCKENQDNCLQYEDLKSKSFINTQAFDNPVNEEAKTKKLYDQSFNN